MKSREISFLIQKVIFTDILFRYFRIKHRSKTIEHHLKDNFHFWNGLFMSVNSSKYRRIIFIIQGIFLRKYFCLRKSLVNLLSFNPNHSNCFNSGFVSYNILVLFRRNWKCFSFKKEFFLQEGFFVDTQRHVFQQCEKMIFSQPTVKKKK